MSAARRRKKAAKREHERLVKWMERAMPVYTKYLEECVWPPRSGNFELLVRG